MKCIKGNISVLLATPLPFEGGVLDYTTPAPVAIGTVVIVPLGARKIAGVVMGEAQGRVAANKLKPIESLAALPPFNPDYITWLDRVASWTLAAHGAVLKMALPQLRFLQPLGQESIDTPISPPPTTQIRLNKEQLAAAAPLRQAVIQGGYAAFLLDGVTGSGKTEVYFEAVAAALAHDRQALILLPEIALSAAVIKRIEARFGVPPLIWHSALGIKARHRAYQQIIKGGPQVIVGARSALFLPFACLGVIIIDEEHDPSYKQDDVVPYHARDMAVLRAFCQKIPIVLVSATPALETIVNAEDGRYQHLTLSVRTGQATLPDIKLVDMGKTPADRGRWLAPPLVEAVEKTLALGQQAMLFLNRRGYAPVLVCRTCGEKIACPNCSAWLVLHKAQSVLSCHHCGHSQNLPQDCPHCQSAGAMVACGPGVERIADEAAHRFPKARQIILSSDTISPKNLAATMAAIETKQVDIIIGTQLVAKGHHFPHLTLVGVVDADLSLGGGDLRAAERTWQLLVQVAGRAGRQKDKGTALLQTLAPQTTVLQALVRGDRDGFIAYEKNARKAAGMPPFARLASILLSSPSPIRLKATAQNLLKSAPQYDGVLILGPAPAPIAYLRGRHRLRFIIRTPKTVQLQAIIKGWLDRVTVPSSVRLQVDIDPQNFI